MPQAHGGAGAWSGSAWFQLQWDAATALKLIAIKEMIPIIIAAAIWGHSWKGSTVQTLCDNAAVVAVVNSRSSCEPDLMQLLQCLFFLEAHFQFHLQSRHVPGQANALADDLSRNRLASFHKNFPDADPLPSPIPPSILQWLLHLKLDWTSAAWTSVNSVRRVWQNPLQRRTSQLYVDLVHSVNSMIYSLHSLCLRLYYVIILPICHYKISAHKLLRHT